MSEVDSRLDEAAEAEYRELNNELVIPSYRRFCEELRIAFHFSDQLPKPDFDAEIARKEEPLHEEAMNLFNRLKSELVLFKDHVVWFQFTDWGGGFTYTKVPVLDFLSSAADDAFYLKKLRHRFKVVTGALAIVVGFGTAVMLARIVPEWFNGFRLLVFVGVQVSVSSWLARRIDKLPRRILDDGRLDKVDERLHRLRSQLEEIRGNAPDPLVRQRGTLVGAAVLEELSRIMTREEIPRFVRRLQSHLAATPTNERAEQEVETAETGQTIRQPVEHPIPRRGRELVKRGVHPSVAIRRAIREQHQRTKSVVQPMPGVPDGLHDGNEHSRKLTIRTDDDLQRLLRPLQELTEEDVETLDPDAHNPDAMAPWDLLAFRPDGMPMWWPENRDEEDGGNWTAQERRRVLLERIRETLPADFPPTPSTPTEKRRLLRTLRHIAYGVTSQASGILSS